MIHDNFGQKRNVSSPGKGHCWNNAVESFSTTLGFELFEQQLFPTGYLARLAIFEFIEVFHNHQRVHQTLDYYRPLEVDLKSIRCA